MLYDSHMEHAWEKRFEEACYYIQWENILAYMRKVRWIWWDGGPYNADSLKNVVRGLFESAVYSYQNHGQADCSTCGFRVTILSWEGREPVVKISFDIAGQQVKV